MNAEINEIVVEIEIAAPKDKVWNEMLDNMGAWWPKNCLALESAEEMKFEPWAGGRQYVVGADGAQILWGTVVGIAPGSTVDIVGYTTPQWGGPAIWMWQMKVEENGGGTKFTLANSIMGKPGHLADYENGWKQIFAGLKEHCERLV